MPHKMSFLLLLACTLLSVGCSAIFDFDSQCDQDSDCDGDRCIAGECIAGPLPCASHFECDQTAALTGSELCIANQCQAVLFDDPEGGGCIELFGQLSEDPADTVVVPVLTALTGDGIGFAYRTAVNGYRMAAQFANESGGLGTRKVVMILCDDASSGPISARTTAEILDRTQATSMLGPSGQASQDTIINSIVPRGVMTFAMTPSILVSTLIDNDLVFRTIPNDQLTIGGISKVLSRFPADAAVGLIYRSDIRERRVVGDALRQTLGTVPVAAVTYDYTAPETVAAAVQELAAANGNVPVDVLITTGLTEIPEVIGAYRDALPNGFEMVKPQIIGDSPVALLIPQIVNADANLTPFDVESVIGAAAATQEFSTLFETTLDTDDPLTLVSLFYDAAMLTLLAHAIVPDATSGAELASALRARVTAADGAVVQGSNGVLAFGEATSALAAGESIRYVQASGGAPAQFDANGDAVYTVVAGTFLDDPPKLYFPTRVLLGDIWYDSCLDFGRPCSKPWSAADENDPGQTCVDVGLRVGICAPNCASGEEMIECPIEAFSCQTSGEAELCLPPR